MSEQQQNGQRRNQGGNRNRNNNNRNRNNNNRNRNNNNRNNNNRSYKKREPKPLVLTGWQKFLKAIGLFNEAKALKKQQINTRTPQRQFGKNAGNKPNNAKANNPKKNNARVAKPRKAPEKVPVETPRLYVGNLSYDASDSDIEELFKGIGNVKNVEIIYNRHTHRSKGYAFVEMARVDEAKRAVEVLHDQPFMGRTLIVNGAKSKGPIDADGDPAPQENPPPNLPENKE